ncbi:MAG: acyl carrier protein [Oscillospiraceae bacterium]|nr:acyl carrier protein [Oscillospiraceae bacterium]
MSRNEITKIVTEIFRDIFDDASLVIDDATGAKDIEDWDSLEQINILVSMEKKFKIKFTVSDVENLTNVGQTIDLIALKLSENLS